MFKKLLWITTCLMLTTFTVSCDGNNFLEEYSKKDTDEAYYFEAKEKIDAFQWDAAIDILNSKLSANYRAKTEVKETLMHAYGGKCGISFFDFINGLKNTTSTKMFEFALRLFTGRIVNMEACDSSLEALHSINEDPRLRTNSQNLFAGILGLTRMATTLKAKFDRDFAGLGDGVVDPSTNACFNSAAALRLSDTEMNRIVAGVGLIFENLAALSDSLTEGSAGSAFEAAKDICELDFGLDELKEPFEYAPPGDSSLDGLTWALIFGESAGYKPTWTELGLHSDFADPLNCLNTKDANVTDKMRRVFRRMIESSDMGFGACDISDVNLTFDLMTKRATVTAQCCPSLVAP